MRPSITGLIVVATAAGTRATAVVSVGRAPRLAICRTSVLAALFVAGVFGGSPSQVEAQETAEALARQLTNPIADLVSVPLQFDIDWRGGDSDDVFYTLTAQPIVPFRVNSRWNLISRSVVPLVRRTPGMRAEGSSWGTGDSVQTLFVSPQHRGPGGLIVGVGPAVLLPTASEDSLGRAKWGIGPAAVALKQTVRWTVGMHVNHLRSFATLERRDVDQDVNDTLLQPFAAYSLGRGRMLFLGLEASYAWDHDQWTAPVNASYAQVFALGSQRVSLQVGGRYFADAPSGAPEWGLRTTLTLLFPRRPR